MPSASPGTSVKKPDPNIKSMCPVSLEGPWPFLALGAELVGLVGGILRQLSCFLPHKGCFPLPVLERGSSWVGRDQGLFLCWNWWPLTPGFVKALVRPLCI